MNIIYRRQVPYPPPVVLSAYFDLEHVGHVHPSSFGRARLLGTRQDTVIWELESPPYLGVRFRNVIAQEYLSLYQIRARVTKGLLRGTEVSVRLEPNDAGTSIEENAIRNSRNVTASFALGMNAASTRNTFAGMCVKTMVSINPKRAASRGETS